MATKVGFIGLGAMGLPMASNLQRKGFDVTVFDLNAGQMERAALVGTRQGRLRGGGKPWRGCGGDSAAGHAARRGGGAGARMVSWLTSIPARFLMDMSTIDAKGTDGIAAACKARNIRFTDCPIGRLALHAERGESLFMVGADDATFAVVEPLLNAMGNAIFRCGAPGDGQPHEAGE